MDENGGNLTRKEYERRQTEVLIRLEKLEGQIINIRDSIRWVETKMDDRATALNLALDKASLILGEKLEGMNQFRRQLDQERGSYITIDKLDLILKTIRAEIEGVRAQIIPLRERGDFNAGKEKGQTATLAAGIAVAAILIELLKTFMGH